MNGGVLADDIVVADDELGRLSSIRQILGGAAKAHGVLARRRAEGRR